MISMRQQQQQQLFHREPHHLSNNIISLTFRCDKASICAHLNRIISLICCEIISLTTEMCSFAMQYSAIIIIGYRLWQITLISSLFFLFASINQFNAEKKMSSIVDLIGFILTYQKNIIENIETHIRINKWEPAWAVFKYKSIQIFFSYLCFNEFH